MTEHTQPKTDEEGFADFLESQESAESQPEVQAEPAAPVAEAPATPAATDEPFPGFSSLSADAQKLVRERLDSADASRRDAEKLRQENSAITGRLAPTQRELEQARKQLKDYQDRQRTESRQPIDKMRDIDPDVFAALTANERELAERFSQTEAQLAEMREVVGQFQARNYSQEQLTEVRKVHPDISEVASSPEFNAWCASLGQKGQARLLAPDAETVAEVISDFKTAYRLAELEIALEQRDSQATPAAPPASQKRHAVDPNPTTRRSAVSAGHGKTYATQEEREFAEHLAMNPS